METDLLEQLWLAFEAGDGAAWIAQHPSDGDLAAAWAASTSPLAVYMFGGIGVERVTLVRALIASANLVAEHLPATAVHSRECLAAAERWLAGAASTEEIARVFDATIEEQARAASSGDGHGAGAVVAAGMPAAVIFAKPSRLPPMRAGHGLSCIEGVVGGARLAAVLRELLPCPTAQTIIS